MSRPEGLPLSRQIPLWALGSSVAGAAIGLAVGVFRPGGFEPTAVLMSVLFGNVVGFTVLFTSAGLSPRLRGLGPLQRGILLALALVSGSAAGTAVVLWTFPLFVLRDLRQAFAVAAINGALALVVGTVVHAYERLRWQLAESLREVEEVRLREAQLREQAARAELAALQARINPHFFFNTLNTISALLSEDPERADDLLQSLAGLFRYTFKAAEAGPVPLGEELEFLREYLAIEQARLGDRLRVVWDLDPSASVVPVPGLILQPLVENAVAHGIAPRASGGTVRVSVRRAPRSLEVEVADDGAGLRDGEGWMRDGHGLDNVVRRLRTLYGDEAELALSEGLEGRGVVARMRIPLDGDLPGPSDRVTT
jgi:hypothetical protein